MKMKLSRKSKHCIRNGRFCGCSFFRSQYSTVLLVIRHGENLSRFSNFKSTAPTNVGGYGIHTNNRLQSGRGAVLCLEIKQQDLWKQFKKARLRKRQGTCARRFWTSRTCSPPGSGLTVLWPMTRRVRNMRG